MKITKGQIKKAYQDKEYLKELFPSVFEEKLEVGKWYKFRKFMILVLDEIHWCGLNCDGLWKEKVSYENLLNDKDFIPAKKEEVETALIVEAKKRGLTIENLHLIKCLEGFNKGVKKNRNKASFFYEYSHNKLWIVDGGFTDCCIFCNGKWAEVIEDPKTIELTIEQIAEKFNVDNVKIIKS